MQAGTSIGCCPLGYVSVIIMVMIAGRTDEQFRKSGMCIGY